MNLLLKNGTFIDWKNFSFTEADIFVEKGPNGKIKLYYPGEADEEGVQVLDCYGKYITKSFANGHHHVYSALSRGMPAPEKAPINFHEKLQYVWWRLDKALDNEMIEASALFTAMECAKNGVSFVIDHHASPFAVEGSLETIANAFGKVGISHLLCYETSDRDGEKVAKAGLEETDSYLQNHQGLVGLHASFTIGDQTLKYAVDLAEKYHSGIHIHVAEDRIDQQDSIEKYGYRVINRLKKFGVTDLPKSILVHCIHLNDEERNILKNAESWVAVNMESNLNNNVGQFSSARLGDNIMLGTDGMHSDMLRAAKATYFSCIKTDKSSPDKLYARFRNIHNYIYQNGINGDGENNLVVLDYPTPTDFNAENFVGHFIYGMEAKHVQHVISDGKLIVKDRMLTQADEGEILEFSKEMGGKLWKQLK
ncbi:MAG: amidohydrolase family protein [Bacteroidales bacterium]|nr:amidohydrolase family protein [Bacteroidales bacterium]MCF8404717.1 amidohydrolase family protein [Bacteroidales bacterium]